jgi:hypothetical protein
MELITFGLIMQYSLCNSLHPYQLFRGLQINAFNNAACLADCSFMKSLSMTGESMRDILGTQATIQSLNTTSLAS